ncbi:unnamed protein product [Musa hybrid cultivar]
MLSDVLFRLKKDLRRACNRYTSSWEGVLPYRCLQMGKVVKQGPWGGDAGKPFDTGVVDRVTNVKIYFDDVVHGLEITFNVGGTNKTMLIGEKKGASIEITLGQDEHFTSISGYFNSGTDIFIKQLTLTTDKDNNISAGKKTGNSFSLTLEGGQIVGFFGLGQPNIAVKAVGVYCSLVDS